MRYHISDNGEPAICHATVKPCPKGQDSPHFDSKEDAQNYVESQNTTLTSVTKKSSRPNSKSIKKHEDYVNSWKERWNQIYLRHYNETWEDMQKRTGRDLVLEDRKNKGTYDGAWYPTDPDGANHIKAGEYYFVSADSIDFYKNESIEKWQNQAWAGTPPGEANGAYLDGKPAYFIAASDMGSNHGYDGEVLFEKDTYKKLKETGIITTDDLSSKVTVTKDTKFYGYRGNPEEIPDTAVSYDADQLAPENDDYFERVALGGVEEPGTADSIVNHPNIKWDL